MTAIRMTKTKPINDIILYQDYREKRPWDFNTLGVGFKLEVVKLHVGDYTIKGMEDILCIEKKNSWEEIGMDISKQSNRVNFIKLLRNMQTYPIRLLIVEDDVSRVIYPRMFKGSINQLSIMQWYIDIQIQYGVTILPVGINQRAKNTILRHLFRKLYEYNKIGKLSTIHQLEITTTSIVDRLMRKE